MADEIAQIRAGLPPGRFEFAPFLFSVGKGSAEGLSPFGLVPRQVTGIPSECRLGCDSAGQLPGEDRVEDARTGDRVGLSRRVAC